MKRNINLLISVFLVAVVVLGRIFNASLHMPNLLPIAAVSLFSGAVLKERRAVAFLLPLLGQFLADVYFQFFTAIPGFYSVSGQLFNYGAILCAAALGSSMKQYKAVPVLMYTLGASLVFFIVSNFGYFAGGWNGYSIQGLTKTYIDAIPFFKNSLIADLVGSVVLFGGYAFVQQALMNKAHKAKA
jgi:hypothetical protein